MTGAPLTRRALGPLLVGALTLRGWMRVAAADEAPSGLGPQELMTKVANEMLAALDQNRAAIRKDPSIVYPLVDKILLPHFDTNYAAQLILAQSWRTATAAQRQRFVSALYTALLKAYGGALADFTADRLTVLPLKVDAAATTATVKTQVQRDNGTVVPVDYRMHTTPGGWKVYDVIIEGISYVKNYREDLGAEIAQKGLDAVITRLEHDGLNVNRATKSSAG